MEGGRKVTPERTDLEGEWRPEVESQRAEGRSVQLDYGLGKGTAPKTGS